MQNVAEYLIEKVLIFETSPTINDGAAFRVRSVYQHHIVSYYLDHFF